MQAVFAEDARLVRPGGQAMVGPQDILTSQTQSFARLRATHHVTCDHVIDVDGDSAQVRATLTAMHLRDPGEGDPCTLESYFLAGDVIHAEARRTPSGRRVTKLEVRVVWRTGAGFSSMLQAGKPPADAS